MKHIKKSHIVGFFLLAYSLLQIPVHGQIATKNGHVYTSEITVKFKLKAFDDNQPQQLLYAQQLKTGLEESKKFFSKYGQVRFRKLFTNSKWGDVTRKNLKGELVTVPDLSQFYRVEFSEPVKMWEFIHALRKLPEVESADPPTTAELSLTPNDLDGPQGSQWNLSKVQATAAWDITTGSSTIRVAVVDHGVDNAHSDYIGPSFE